MAKNVRALLCPILKDKEPTYDSLIESKKRRIAFIFSFVSSIHQLEVFVIGKF